MKTENQLVTGHFTMCCLWPAVFLSLKNLLNYRDESGSATFYFREHTEPGTKRHPSCDIAKPVSDNLEEVWMYYRTLKTGENEFPLRNKQVRKSQYSSDI